MSNPNEDSIAFGILVGIAIIILFPLSFFTVMKLWEWFVVPLGMPQIGLWHAGGLGLIIGYLAQRRRSKSDDAGTASILLYTYAKIGFALLLGWLLQFGVA